MHSQDSSPETNDASVRELLERWRAGDQSAADHLHSRYAQQLARLVERQLGSGLRRRVDAEDVVQSVFRSFFRRTSEGQYRVDHSGALWRLLVKITQTKVRKQADHHRAGKRDIAAEMPLDELEIEAIAKGPGPEDAVVFQDLLETLLVGLNETEREIVGLHLAGEPVANIAVELGCTRWAVRRTVARVASRAAALLEQHRRQE